MTARCGFTLLELMVASAISVVVATAIGTFFIGAHRLVKHSSSVARASLDLRAEREHLLFHSNHEGGNAHWGGLLSATDVDGSGTSQIRYTANGCDSGSGSSMSRSGQSYPNNDAKPHATVSIGSSSGSTLCSVILTRTIGDADAGHQVFTLKDRVLVPAFGKSQSTSNAIFSDEEVER